MAYNPQQPRVPAGNSEGGQWTAWIAAGLPGKNAEEVGLYNYLESVDKITSGNSVESYVLKHGEFFQPGPLPAGVRKMADKQCFKNAAELAVIKDYDYVEGFAFPDFINLPVHHAWVVDETGGVIDNTWKKPGVAYFGVKFSEDALMNVLADSGTYGVLDFSKEAFRRMVGR